MLVELVKRRCGGACGKTINARADLCITIPVYCPDCRLKSGKPKSDWMSPYAGLYSTQNSAPYKKGKK